MARRILFSLPVHERPDIVEGQIANLARHCPGAGVCIHVSAGFVGDMAAWQRLERHPGVFVNPNRLATIRGTGLFHAHVVNFIHGMQCCGDVAVFAFLSSNELFVRAGLQAQVERFQAAAQVEMFDPAAGWHIFDRRIDRHPQVAALLAHLGLPTIFGGQAEGQFYEIAVFGEMARLYLRFFTLGPSDFETEEVLPQTTMLKLVDDARPISPPFTLQNYSNVFDIDAPLIEAVRRGRGFVFGRRNPQQLRSPHLGLNDLTSIVSLKRVPREDCALRSAILDLDDGAAEPDPIARPGRP